MTKHTLIILDFQLSQHKPHLGLPRTWIISTKVMQIAGWNFRGRASTCHECTVIKKAQCLLSLWPRLYIRVWLPHNITNNNIQKEYLCLFRA